MRTGAIGAAGLAGTGTSIGLTVVVALLGPSAMEPALPGRPGQPPYSLVAHPSPHLVVALAGAALVVGTAGLGLSLYAVRRGWAPSPRALLVGGIFAAAVLAFMPPFGSADHLSYAAYGRMLVTGHDPFATGPNVMGHDPIARAVEDWRTTPSVYGPLAVGGQALASLVGGTSVRLTVFVLSLLNLAAFAGVGLLLHRLAGRDRSRELRAALLWTFNPLLMYELMAGAHVDTQAAALSLAAVAVFPAVRRSGSAGWRAFAGCLAAGALTGLGAAVKLTSALPGGGLAWVARSRWRWLAGLAVGFTVLAAAAFASGGPNVLRQAVRGGRYVSIGSPWRGIRTALTAAFGGGTASTLVSAGSLALAVVLLVVFLRGLPGPRALPDGLADAAPDPAQARAAARLATARAALAFTLAWLFAWPYVLPWYDGLAWALLPLAVWSWVDWLMLARTAALAFGYLPAIANPVVPFPADLGWLQSVVRTGVTPTILALLTVAAVVACIPRWMAPSRAGSTTAHDHGGFSVNTTQNPP
ncbi:MAG: polyprenol phosphomannose-dependent alpha 1,6 mannosyltransferase MptB [Micromonosporaceae bacterium]